MNNKDWKKTKTIYWSDELNDDFNEIGLSRPEVPKNYKYLITRPLEKLIADFVYWIVAKIALGLVVLFFGIKVKGRKNLNKVFKIGAFLYSNHVSLVNDVYKFHIVIGHKKVNIIGYSDSLSLKPIRPLLKSLGYLPLPLHTDANNFKKLQEAVIHLTRDKKQIVVIYPEAHVWPYYTKIRNFQSGSFVYPVKANVPILPAVTVWRKSKFSKKPKQLIVFSEPIYPKQDLSELENRIYLHDECLKAMKKISESYEQYEYIKYIKVEKN